MHHDDVIKWKHFLRNWPFVRGIHRSPVNSPHKGQWSGAFDVFFDLRLYKRLSKPSWGWWFETLSRPLWRHCNVTNLCLSLWSYDLRFSVQGLSLRGIQANQWFGYFRDHKPVFGTKFMSNAHRLRCTRYIMAISMSNLTHKISITFILGQLKWACLNQHQMQVLFYYFDLFIALFHYIHISPDDFN